MAGHSLMPAPTGEPSTLLARVELLDSSRVLAPAEAALSENHARANEVRMPRLLALPRCEVQLAQLVLVTCLRHAALLLTLLSTVTAMAMTRLRRRRGDGDRDGDGVAMVTRRP